MSFSLVPLLLTGEGISPEARQALRENRLQDAGELLMQKYGLTCIEASHLLDVPLCKESTPFGDQSDIPRKKSHRK
jgi:hypothetical protein